MSCDEVAVCYIYVWRRVTRDKYPQAEPKDVLIILVGLDITACDFFS